MNWFNCTGRAGVSMEQVLRTMVKDNGTGKPVISLNQASVLQPWHDCDNQNISIWQLARLLIVEDEAGKPAWNTTNL